MFAAKVGDDVYKEDPSINELQQKAAAIFGKEAGLYCPSGTMTNQAAIKAHTQPGDEVLCDISAHIFNYEGGGMAFNSGVQAKLINGDRGRFTAKQVEEVIHTQADWLPNTSLVCIESTSNRGGGSYYKLQSVREIAEVCKTNNLALHLDGARIFNALAETGESPNDYGKVCDSISVCFSKGLGAPVGSVLLGSNEFIAKARRVRKLFGGGMRQGGYLAAAAIYAIEHHVQRLKEDHKKANYLGKLLQAKSFVTDMLPVETNIVIFSLDEKISAEQLVQNFKKSDILISATGKQTVRMVTHLDFNDEMLEIVEKTMESM